MLITCHLPWHSLPNFQDTGVLSLLLVNFETSKSLICQLKIVFSIWQFLLFQPSNLANLNWHAFCPWCMVLASFNEWNRRTHAYLDLKSWVAFTMSKLLGIATLFDLIGRKHLCTICIHTSLWVFIVIFHGVSKSLTMQEKHDYVL